MSGFGGVSVGFGLLWMLKGWGLKGGNRCVGNFRHWLLLGFQPAKSQHAKLRQGLHAPGVGPLLGSAGRSGSLTPETVNAVI